MKKREKMHYLSIVTDNPSKTWVVLVDETVSPPKRYRMRSMDYINALIVYRSYCKEFGIRYDANKAIIPDTPGVTPLAWGKNQHL